mmetsp:Transcript_3365/g.7430  ORF Transcript_3365/g.7430 Transcript_3365/m.7430 type:complete len:81 (-) Transcript_3365:200-442(-)
MRVLASERDTLATMETASLRARILGGTTELMHFIHGGFWNVGWSESSFDTSPAVIVCGSDDWTCSDVDVDGWDCDVDGWL